MRIFLSLTIFVFSVFAGNLFGRKMPVEIIPQLANAKTIGVYCSEGEDIVDIDDCQLFIDSLSLDLPTFRVEKVFETLDSDDQLTETAPKPWDVEVDVSSFWHYPDPWTGDENPTTYDAIIYDSQANKLADFSGNRECGDGGYNQIYDEIGCVEGFILLYSGQASAACAVPIEHWGPHFTESRFGKLVARLCIENGFWNKQKAKQWKQERKQWKQTR